MRTELNNVNAQDSDALESTDFDRLVDRALSRRSLLKGGMAAGMLGFFSLSPMAQAVAAALEPSRLLGFQAIQASTEDAVVLPAGYRSSILMSWGDPVLPGAPEFDHQGGNSAADQALQFGDNTDGMTLFHFKRADGSIDPDRAVLAVNNEYCNYKYLLGNGQVESREDVEKAKAAHGVTVVELVREGGKWRYLKDSKLNRRIHLETEMALTGPVAGHSLVKTAADPSGRKVLGTVNNCANGRTPWGTYLTCEENFHGYFGAERDEDVPAELAKYYGVKAAEERYQWWQHDARFNLSKTPNEPNRFGWVVEIDPFDPESKPMKRTALGRVKHENAELVLNADGHAVVYMGDDERGEHLYRFVSSGKYDPANDAANRTLLEDGTLYVAQFNGGEDDKHAGTGRWVELTHGKNGLSAANGFADQATVLVNTRQAAKQVGATSMDRPEWVSANPLNGQVYCALTNNKNRGKKDDQPLNGPNPRVANHYGQIVRWEAKGGDHTAEEFAWDLYLIAGNPAQHQDAYAGTSNINAENMFNSPDGLGFDKDGRLWILTDGEDSNEGDFAGMGNNQMLCGDPATGEIRRFLVGPTGCEVTGLTFSDDHKTMFVGIQHPSGGFPDYQNGGKPRSSIVMVTREDGGVIGAA
jgi:hypothetical protein